MRRWLLRVAAVVALLAIGFVPFTTPIDDGADLHIRCRGTLIEAWPETESSGSGWFSYAPNGEGLVYVPSPLSRSVCGTEARERLVPAVALLVAAVAGALVVSRRRASRRTTGR